MTYMCPSICIVLCYYGTFPNTFQLYLDSCAFNSTINWLLVTDEENLQRKYTVPQNLTVLNMELKDVEKLASKKMGFDVCIPTPYKLCDYKVAYGLIFEDYLKEYEWWGYGDCDVVYGDLRKFFTSERIEKYDKIYPLGHLSILKNNDACKRAFLLSAPKTYDARSVYSQPNTVGFDEHNGINMKMFENGMKVDLTNDFVDRSTFFKRFCTIDKKDITPYFYEPWVDKVRFIKNRKRQLFVWKNGHAYQYYVKNNKICSKELCYIHYRCRYRNFFTVGEKMYILGANQIVVRDGENGEILMDDFQNYNRAEKLERITRAKKVWRAKIDQKPQFRQIILVLKRIKKLLAHLRKKSDI